MPYSDIRVLAKGHGPVKDMIDLVPVDGRVSSPVRTALADICGRFIRHEDPGLAGIS